MTSAVSDGYTFWFGPLDRVQTFRSAAAEMRALRPAIELLARNPNRTADDEADQQALALAFRDAAFRYALAAPLPGALETSGLLIWPVAEQRRLIAEAGAYRQGALDLARGMAESDFFEGISPREVVARLFVDAPASAGRYLDALALLAGVEHLPQSVLSGDARRAALRNLGRGLVAAARGVEQERWGGQPLFRDQCELAQWDTLYAELLGIATKGVSETDGRAVRAGMREETGRRFYPAALALLSGGVLGAIGRATPARSGSHPRCWTTAGDFWGRQIRGSRRRGPPRGCQRRGTWSRSCRAARRVTRPGSTIRSRHSMDSPSRCPTPMVCRTSPRSASSGSTSRIRSATIRISTGKRTLRLRAVRSGRKSKRAGAAEPVLAVAA
jgi:hypothetical protein